MRWLLWAGGGVAALCFGIAGLMWIDPSEFVNRSHWSSIVDEFKEAPAPKPRPRPKPQRIITVSPTDHSRCGHIDCDQEDKAHEHYSMMPIKWICVDVAEQGVVRKECIASMTVELLLFNPTDSNVVFERVACAIARRHGEELTERDRMTGRHDKHLPNWSPRLRWFGGLPFPVKARDMRVELFRFIAGPFPRDASLHLENPFCSVTLRKAKDILTFKAQ